MAPIHRRAESSMRVTSGSRRVCVRRLHVDPAAFETVGDNDVEWRQDAGVNTRLPFGLGVRT